MTEIRVRGLSSLVDVVERTGLRRPHLTNPLARAHTLADWPSLTPEGDLSCRAQTGLSENSALASSS